jgi:hypothetical protein
MRSRLAAIVSVPLGLLGGCAAIGDLAESTRERASYELYGRQTFAELARTSRLEGGKFACDGQPCPAFWTGSQIAGYWDYRSARPCAVESREDWICVSVVLAPPRGGGSYRLGLTVEASGPRPVGERPLFSPETIEIDGLDQDLWMY